MNRDAELVSRIREGDSEALVALYDRYKKRLFRTALAITDDQGAAEEILQDCFLKAYRSLSRVDCSAPLGPWLHRIVVNLSYNWVVKRRPWSVSVEEMIDRLVAAPQLSPEHAYERKELHRRLHEAIKSLNIYHRLVVMLFYLQGFSLTEIAYILECPVGTVKSRLHHARKILKGKLAEEKAVPREAYDLSSL
ncbi:MAG: sigma-70 family RNA polymerase sigma factor [Anaerolineae bacterium]|nr:sigma-70 family RNA polymerase sigma factor [Anaerolineae bacterium]